MICAIKSPAERRYVVRMCVAAALSVLFSAVAALVFRLGHPHGVVAYLVAVLPALPIMGALVGTGMYLSEEKDEFQRNLLVQALLGGTGATLAAITAWGYMEDFAHAPHMDLVWVYPAFWAFAGIAYAVVWRRYR
jgi:hypothetical protein